MSGGKNGKKERVKTADREEKGSTKDRVAGRRGGTVVCDALAWVPSGPREGTDTPCRQPERRHDGSKLEAETSNRLWTWLGCLHTES